MRFVRGRGWFAVLGLVLATVLLSAVNAALLVFVPLALLLIALPPARPWLVGIGAAIVGLALAGPGGLRESFWYVERAWVLLLGGWFVLAAALWKEAPFLPRALTALAATTISAAAVVAATRGWAQLDTAMAGRYSDAARQAAALWSTDRTGPELGEAVRTTMQSVAEFQALVYPALLALASLAGLALSWWAYRRVSSAEARPLDRFREFRFRDELVWLFLAGLALVALPLGQVAVRAGANVLTFMGALYAVRGLAVVAALVGSPGIGGMIVAILALVFLYPIVMLAALVLGLCDTWLDLRRRRAAAGTEP